MTAERYVTLLGGPPWGFRVSGGKDQDFLPFISQVIAQSKAAKQGLLVGDRVMAINGHALNGLPQNDVQNLLKKVNGVLRLTVKKNTGPGSIALQSRYTSTEEKEPVTQQPKSTETQPIYLRHRTDSMESDITGLGRRLTLLTVATKDFVTYQRFQVKNPVAIAANVTRSAMSSQENLFSFPKFLSNLHLPVQWNPHRKQARQWAPVKFYPAPQKFQPADQSRTEIRAPSQSAPVTPVGRSTPAMEVSEKAHSKHILSPNTPKLEMFVDRHKSFNRRTDNKSTVVTNQPVFSSVSGLPKAASFRLSVPRPYASLPPVHEGLLLSSSSSLYVDTNLSPAASELKNRRRDVDRISSFSDLDGRKSNCSLFDTESGSISDAGRYNSLNFDNVFDGAASRIYNDVISTGNQTNRHQNHNSNQLHPKHHRIWPNETSASLSQLFPDDVAFRADSACSDHPSLATTSLLGIDMDSSTGSQVADLETCFDSAIESATTGGGGVGAKMFDDLSIPDQQIREEAFFENMKKYTTDPAGTNKSDNYTKIMNGGPGYHLIQSSNEPHYPLAFQPQNLIVRTSAPWTQSKSNAPSSTAWSYEKNSSTTGTKFPSDSSTNLNSMSSVDYNPVQSKYHSDYSSKTSSQYASRTGGGNVANGVSSGVMPPPPPPPPPPPALRSSSHGRTQYTTSRQKSENEMYSPQSTVEYPEKQSVSSLKSTIQMKLNGSGPRKGTQGGGPTSTTSSAMEISKQEHDYQLPVSQQKPSAENGFPSSRSERQVYYSSYASSQSRRREEVTSAYDVAKSVGKETHPALEELKSPYTTWTKNDDLISPPARLFAPSNLLSPVPPPRPPTPLEFKSKTAVSRPDNFARPYDSSSFRDGAVVVTKTPYYAPQKSTYMSRTEPATFGSKDGGLLQVKDYGADFSSDVISQGKQNFGSREQQHHWYKRIYKKMHTMDLPEDETVYRYRMKDYLGDRYINKNADHSPTISEGGQQRVNYKFSEYLSEPEAEGDSFLQSETRRQHLYTSSDRNARRNERENFVRSTRSKSADRFDTSAPSSTVDSYRYGASDRRVPLKSDYSQNYSTGDAWRTTKEAISTSSVEYNNATVSDSSATNKLFSLFSVLSAIKDIFLHKKLMIMEQNKFSSSKPSATRYGSDFGGNFSVDSKQTNQYGSSFNDDKRRDASRNIYSSSFDDKMLDVGGTKSKSANALNSLPFELEELEKLERELKIAQDNLARKESGRYPPQRSSERIYASDVKRPVVQARRDFDSTISSKSAPMSPSGDFRGVGRALYSYDAHAPGELNFFKGDLIKIRRRVDDNWYEGEVRGQAGIIPANFIEIKAAATGDERLMVTEVASKIIGKAQALYNFDGRKFNELPLQKGEIVSLLRKIDELWYEGKNNMGRLGMFPSNYVRVFSEPSSTLTDFVQKVDQPSSETSAKPSYPSLSPRPSSETVDRRLNKTAPDLSKADTYKVLYNYKPEHADELELNENDIIYVIEKCDDNWYIGTSLRSGKFGTFPGNYVTLL